MGRTLYQPGNASQYELSQEKRVSWRRIHCREPNMVVLRTSLPRSSIALMSGRHLELLPSMGWDMNTSSRAFFHVLLSTHALSGCTTNSCHHLLLHETIIFEYVTMIVRSFPSSPRLFAPSCFYVIPTGIATYLPEAPRHMFDDGNLLSHHRLLDENITPDQSPSES